MCRYTGRMCRAGIIKRGITRLIIGLFYGGMGILLQECNESLQNLADSLSDIGNKKLYLYADNLSNK